MQVNRWLENKRFDRIDHALGRPVNPLHKTYRNHYATEMGGPQALELASDPAWHIGLRSGDMLFFYVTKYGRHALHSHLREIGDRHRIWHIEWDGMHLTQIAESRGKAMYQKWLSVSDTCDVSFGTFVKAARVHS